MNGRAAGGIGPGERFLCLLFPARCLLCGEPVSPGGFFCGPCGKTVSKSPCERSYALPGSGGQGFRVLSPLPYRGGVRKTLYQYKFRGERALSKPLGRLMAQTVWDLGGPFDGVAYVPLSQRSRKKRGYDQSRLLAKELARSLGLPLLGILEKTRETETQHELSRRERVKNVKNAYRAFGEAAGKSLLLVDDIVTTGATLRECAGALYRVGAIEVCGLCAADAELENYHQERGAAP